jgi:tape measure domain-containing protein
MKRIALESRSDFDAVGDLFAKITFATKEMGLSQQEVADATQTVANTFIISGASAIEAANASRQLAQGLASGTLRGDELNSVMEQNSALAELLAQGLGVSTGKLREMGAAGKITAENILPTLIAATDETSATVADMNVTIGQAITNLKTQFTTLVGDFNSSTNAFGNVANSINFLAQNMELLIIPITALAVTAIPSLIAALNTLKIAIMANPVGLLATGFAALVSVLMIANKNSKEFGTTLQELHASRLKQNAKLVKAEANYERFKAKQYDLDVKRARKNIEEIDALILAKEKQTEIENKLNDAVNNLGQNVTTNMQNAIQVTKNFADTVEGELTNAFKTFFDFTNKEFLDFKNLATSVTQAVINELIQVFIVQKLVEGITTGITNIGGIIKAGGLGNIVDGIQNLDGGGYTGNGIRAGGLDGKGGRLAMIHPQETVIDHTKGQAMQSAPTVNFNISTVDAAGFDKLLASRKGLITSIINNAMNNQGKMGVV